MNDTCKILLIAAGLLLFSCSSDDGCTQEDWVGTYVGMAECDGEENTDETFIIGQENGSLVLVDSGSESYPIEVNGCNMTIPEYDLIIATVRGSGTLSDNQLEMELIIEGFGMSQRCLFTGAK